MLGRREQEDAPLTGGLERKAQACHDPPGPQAHSKLSCYAAVPLQHSNKAHSALNNSAAREERGQEDAPQQRVGWGTQPCALPVLSDS